MRNRSFPAMRAATGLPAGIMTVRTAVRAAVASCVAALALGIAASPASAAPSPTTPWVFGVCQNGGLTALQWDGVRADAISLHWIPMVAEDFGTPTVTRLRARQTMYSTSTPVTAGGDAWVVHMKLLRRGTVLLEKVIFCD